MPIVIGRPIPSITLATSQQERLRTVFFGTPQFAVPALRALHDHAWPIAAVVTAPDKPVGRKQVLTPSPVNTVALEHGIATHTPATLKDDAFFQWFTNLKPDLCIVVAYGKIIPQRYLDAVRLGFINIHPSLLPAYRGPSPVASAVLDGCANTGVSLMLLDAEMDHGPVLAQEPWSIPSGFDTPACEGELARIGADLLLRTLPEYTAGHITPQPQDHTAATFTKKFERADGRINWTQSATAIYNRIRALHANPGTWTTWHDAQLNIIDAHVAAIAPSGENGTLHKTSEGIVVCCGTGAIVLNTIQPAGSKPMPAPAFANGHPNFIGAKLI